MKKKELEIRLEEAKEIIRKFVWRVGWSSFEIKAAEEFLVNNVSEKPKFQHIKLCDCGHPKSSHMPSKDGKIQCLGNRNFCQCKKYIYTPEQTV